ncbi:fructose-bisphosphate aldolase class I [soil metagenome]
MTQRELAATIKEVAIKGRGILAADESTATITKRFQAIGVESTEENRRSYRELLFTTEGLGEFISGVILYEETLSQKTAKGETFVKVLQQQGIVPGIKVDMGLINLANTADEKVTQGLDGLPERLAKYKALGARFAKWRAVFNIDAQHPSTLATKTNAEALARYAAICQSLGIVPIVEPELLIDGNHSFERCKEATEEVLHSVFNALHRHKVVLEHMILKPSMVIAGQDCKEQASIDAVAKATVEVLLRTVPAAVPSIKFLSGGQSSALATANLNAMNALNPQLPWQLSFSYGRALQDTALKAWGGKAENVAKAQQELFKRAKLNSAACWGKYSDAMEG